MPAASAPISSTASRCRTVRATSNAASESSDPRRSSADRMSGAAGPRSEQRIQGEERGARGLAVSRPGRSPGTTPRPSGRRAPPASPPRRRTAPSRRPGSKSRQRLDRPITARPATPPTHTTSRLHHRARQRTRAPRAIQRHRPIARCAGGSWPRGEGSVALGPGAPCPAPIFPFRGASGRVQVPSRETSPVRIPVSGGRASIAVALAYWTAHEPPTATEAPQAAQRWIPQGLPVALSVGIVAGFLGVLGVVGYVIASPPRRRRSTRSSRSTRAQPPWSTRPTARASASSSPTSCARRPVLGHPARR